MGFISFNNDKYFNDPDFVMDLPIEDRYCREVLNTNRIMHVYVVMPENTAICVEYLSKKGDWFSIYESFHSEAECTFRFNQIKNILEEESK